MGTFLSGVPEGTVLGPTVDILVGIESEIHLFAEDCVNIFWRSGSFYLSFLVPL